MPELINMKMTGEEQTAGQTTALTRPDYPMGLCLHLDDDALKKLGIDALPPVGEAGMLIARYEVKTTYQTEHENMSCKQMSIQITDLVIEGSKDEKEKAADKLYKQKGQIQTATKLPPGMKPVDGGYF